MEAKCKFLESLKDEQLGFFFAHEYNPELEELFLDVLTPNQYDLFNEWKKQANAQVVALVNVKSTSGMSLKDSLELKAKNEEVYEIASQLKSLKLQLEALTSAFKDQAKNQPNREKSRSRDEYHTTRRQANSTEEEKKSPPTSIMKILLHHFNIAKMQDKERDEFYESVLSVLVGECMVVWIESKQNSDEIVVVQGLMRQLEKSKSDDVQLVVINTIISISNKITPAQKETLGTSALFKIVNNCISNSTNEILVGKYLLFLWNMTDELPINCLYFCSTGGLANFEQVHTRFQRNVELIRCALGVLGNVAEVKDARPLLREAPLLNVLIKLTRAETYSIKINELATSILAQLVGDGSRQWKVVEPSHQGICQLIQRVVPQWKVDISLGVSYQTLKGLTYLLETNQASQLYAVWALLNVITEDKDKYLPKMINEKATLLRIQYNSETLPYTKELTERILKNFP